MLTSHLKIFDETLRDGEQQAGLCFSYEEKMKLAALIKRTGVHRINIMPSIDSGEKKLVQTLVDDGFRSVLEPATMMGKKFINQSSSCGVERIILFNAVSDRLMFIRDRKVLDDRSLSGKTIDDSASKPLIGGVRQRMMDTVLEHLQYATGEGFSLKVDFAAEDASRADHGFLVECIQTFSPYIDHFMLCDTVGILEPEGTYRWVKDIVSRCSDVPIAVHFHNDMGLALENTIKAVEAGASMVSGTFSGIGERAGNVALEQVLNGLKKRHGVEVNGINYDAIQHVTGYLESLNVRPVPPYSEAACRHETGIHVNSIMRDRLSYTAFENEEPEIWFGKFCGSSNFEYVFRKELGLQLSPETCNRLRVQVKRLAIEKHCAFSTESIIGMYKDGLLDV